MTMPSPAFDVRDARRSCLRGTAGSSRARSRSSTPAPSTTTGSQCCCSSGGQVIPGLERRREFVRARILLGFQIRSSISKLAAGHVEEAIRPGRSCSSAPGSPKTCTPSAGDLLTNAVAKVSRAERHAQILRDGRIEKPVALALRNPVERADRAGEDGLHVRRECLEETEDFGLEGVGRRLPCGESTRVLKEPAGDRARHRGVLSKASSLLRRLCFGLEPIERGTHWPGAIGSASTSTEATGHGSAQRRRARAVVDV